MLAGNMAIADKTVCEWSSEGHDLHIYMTIFIMLTFTRCSVVWGAGWRLGPHNSQLNQTKLELANCKTQHTGHARYAGVTGGGPSNNRAGKLYNVCSMLSDFTHFCLALAWVLHKNIY